MGKFKNSIIYAVIGVLCLASVGGYLIKKPTAITDVFASLGGGGKAHAEAVMKQAALAPNPNPTVAIAQGDDYAASTKKVIEDAGGLQDIIKKGNTVLIKPNLCTTGSPGSQLITDYRAVAEVVRQAKELGAAKVIIADGAISGNSLTDTALETNKYNTIKDVEFININDIKKEDCYELKPEKSLTGKALFLPKVYMDADVVITVAKLKTHFQPDAVVTLSLKNSFGATSGEVYAGGSSKDGLHTLGLKESVIDLNNIRRPDFAIIEGIVGGQGNGPLAAMPVPSKVMFAGKDLVALDTVALTYMGFTVAQVPHVKLAGEQNMGITDLTKIKVVGADLNAIKKDFKSEYKKNIS